MKRDSLTVRAAFRAVFWVVFLLPFAIRAEDTDCESLRRAIAETSDALQTDPYQQAIRRQRTEIAQAEAYARQIGCDQRKFLFFGADPPMQCEQVEAQLKRMHTNLQDLRARVSGSSHEDLLARYNRDCSASAHQPQNFLDKLFGKPRGSGGEEPLPATGDNQAKDLKGNAVEEARSGNKTVCVRSCDGYFFPLSVSVDPVASQLCRALCPNAEASVYTYPLRGEIEQAVGLDGTRYMDSPNALRYRRTLDTSCTCLRRGQTWSSSMIAAENLLNDKHRSDIIVTPNKAAELSRPKMTVSDTRDSAIDSNGVDRVLHDAALAIGKESAGDTGIADVPKAEPTHPKRGTVFYETAPDGTPRKVRIIGE